MSHAAKKGSKTLLRRFRSNSTPTTITTARNPLTKRSNVICLRSGIFSGVQEFQEFRSSDITLGVSGVQEFQTLLRERRHYFLCFW